MTTPNHQPVFPHVIDATIVSTYRMCQYYAMLRHILGYDTAERSIHLHWGGCLAKGLEIARKAFYSGGATPDAALAAGLRSLLHMWGDWPVRLEDGKWTERNKSLEACTSALALYLEKWPLGVEPARPVRTATNEPAIEIVHALPIPGVPPHPVTGKPLHYAIRADMVVEVHPTGWYMGLDEKSTGSSLDAKWHDKFRLRSQFLGYTWGLRQLGVPVRGIIVRGIAPLAQTIELAETMILPTQRQIDRWLRMLQLTTIDMINSWRTGMWKWDLGDACNAFNRSCPYMRLCVADDPLQWIDDGYTVDRWNPLETRG